MDLNKFQYSETLSSNPTEKKIVVLGTVKDQPGEAILIIVAKVPGQKQYAFNAITEIFRNDIYSRFDTKMLGQYEIQAIFPITQKHKDKYKQKSIVMYEETAEEYLSNRDSLLEKELLHIDWVRNIVEGKAEVERVLFKNEDFVILPDFKFADLQEIDSLHLLTIFSDEKLCSIRDLTSEHIPVLQSARKQISKVLEQKFKLDIGFCRVYFHYPPTFYRLHIHISNLKVSAATALSERAHLLTSHTKSENSFRLLQKSNFDEDYRKMILQTHHHPISVFNR